MPHAKPNLPTKLCATCGRPFTWRKKWARDWDQVKYCSDACRSKAPKSERNTTAETKPSPDPERSQRPSG